MSAAVGEARVGVGSLGGLASEVERNLRGFDFAGVGVAGQLGDAEVVEMASLVFHNGEDVGGVLTEDRVKGDEGLKHEAPFILIEAAHAVERGGKRRLLDGWKVAGAKGLFGAVEDVFELRELEGLRKNGDLFEEERVASLGLLGVDRERFGGPDALRGREITFGEVNDTRKFFVAIDKDMREGGEGSGGLFAMKERSLEHPRAFEEFELRREFSGSRGFAARGEYGFEALVEAGEAFGEAVGRGTGDCLPVSAEGFGVAA
jgi:hypothetical protein